jgi:hypothetical protein
MHAVEESPYTPEQERTAAAFLSALLFDFPLDFSPFDLVRILATREHPRQRGADDKQDGQSFTGLSCQ